MTAFARSTTNLDAAAGGKGFGWRFTTPLYVGAALNPVNSSIIATALVPIATALHVSVGSATVLVSCLYLASAVAQPTAGKLAEELGPRRVFLSGVLLVLLGGLVGGFGQSLAVLTVARVLIGIGTSAGYPSAMVLIRCRAAEAGMSTPPGGVLGGMAIAGMAVAAVGPSLGGVLVDAAGWHWAFLINIPVTAMALAMAVRWVPHDPPAPPHRDLRTLAARIDVGGIICFGGTMTALVIFIMSLPRADWTALAAAVVLAGLLVWWELRTPTPFFDLRGLRANGALARTYLRSALTLLGAYTVMYGVTQWMESARGLSAQQAGLVLLPMGVLSALLTRPLSRRNLIRGPLVTAALTMLLGSLGIAFLTAHTPVVLIVAVTLVFGVALATTTVGNQTALYTQAPPEQIGTAAGLLRTFGYLGSIASAAVTGMVFKDGATDSGLHSLGIVLVVAAAAVLAMTLLDRHLKTPGRPEGRPGSTSKENTPVSTTPALDPKHTALLVMDFQPAILAALPEDEAAALLDRVEKSIAEVRAHGATIAYVRVAFTESDWDAVPATNKSFALAAQHRVMHHEEPTTAIHQRLAPRDGDIVVRKIRFGGMSTTDLDQQLRDRDITHLVLSGISTSGVVLSTVIDAADRDYQLYVLSDGVADSDADAHKVLLGNVFPSRAHIIDTAELGDLLRTA
ncbi:MFS transporter [Streptomyces sp. NPDC005356]|uniref:MFS transporter n=1 Tax=Streptomyces sp. NPDC005356 TaxID=3157167 RepID=UPI0033A66652